MICEEVMVDLRIPDPNSFEEGKRLAQLAFKLNHTMPMTDEYQQILKELFGDNLGEGSYCCMPPGVLRNSIDCVFRFGEEKLF